MYSNGHPINTVKLQYSNQKFRYTQCTTVIILFICTDSTDTESNDFNYSDQAKYMGINIDSRLNWTQHSLLIWETNLFSSLFHSTYMEHWK